MIAGTYSLLLHLLASFAFVGVIWYVQLISYPQMRNVAPQNWKVYEQEHTKRSFWLIAPLFILETLGTIGVSIYFWGGMRGLIVANLVAYTVAYGFTFAVHLPLHRLLETSHQDKWIEELINKNWWRTLAWTGKGIIAFLMAIQWL